MPGAGAEEVGLGPVPGQRDVSDEVEQLVAGELVR